MATCSLLFSFLEDYAHVVQAGDEAAPVPANPGERCATWKSCDSDDGFRKLLTVA
jgi:hypothetical protein